MSRIKKLNGLIVFYNGSPMIEYSLRLIRPFVNKIIAIDGRYKYRDGNILSDKNTLKYVNKYCDEVFQPYEAWDSQVEKRSFSLQYAQLFIDNEYVLIFDSDELFFGNWRKTWRQIKNNKLEVGWVKKFDPIGVNGFWSPRIIKLSGKMEYRYNHATIYKDNEKLHSLDGKLTKKQEKFRQKELLPLAFLHVKMLMPNEYLTKQQQYYNYRKENNIETKAFLGNKKYN